MKALILAMVGWTVSFIKNFSAALAHHGSNKVNLTRGFCSLVTEAAAGDFPSYLRVYAKQSPQDFMNSAEMY